jgi:hypothetical protein
MWCSADCREGFADQHTWWRAQKLALRRDGFRCVEADDPELECSGELQVDHVPRAPHYGPGCQHHLDRLFTRCEAHHLRRHGKRKRIRTRQLTLL